MKILTVADFFYPEVVGGGAIMAYEIMRELVSRGHSVTVLTRRQADQPAVSDLDGMKIVRYKIAQRQMLYPLGVMRARGEIKRLLEQEEFDLFNMHHASGGIAAILAQQKKRSVPAVFFFQGPWYKEAIANDDKFDEYESRAYKQLELKYWMRKKVDRFMLENCQAFVTLSDHMRKEALEICPGAADKHVKVPGGVDVDRFKIAQDTGAIREKLALPKDMFVLFTARRLARRMGLENLVQAMATVEKLRDDVVLVIGGRGELWDSLNVQIKRLGLKRTLMAGYISYDEALPSYYQASDLFIMPSITMEGFGLSTMESLACGTPVLGTPTGGTPEILQGILPDFILNSAQPEDIAKGIIEKLPVLRDADLQQRTRKFAEDFSWRRITDKVEDLFCKLVRTS